jgi:predicted RNase H-like nuclease (RuvC/YqgF family)
MIDFKKWLDQSGFALDVANATMNAIAEKINKDLEEKLDEQVREIERLENELRALRAERAAEEKKDG